MELAHSIVYSRKKLMAKLRIVSLEKDYSKLLELIQFDGRVKTAYSTFFNATFHFPSLPNVEIVFLPGLHASSRIPFSLRVDFPDTPQPPNLSAKRLTVIKARYNDLRAKRLNVHAEICLIFHLLREGGNIQRNFIYLGISTKFCFLCHHMFAGIGIFGTRGCHEVLETQWTLSSTFDLDARYSGRIYSLVMNLQTLLTEQSKFINGTQLDRKAQSEPVMSDSVSTVDRQAFATRMRSSVQANEDHDEAIMWEKIDDR